jgi:hypothetical protein
MPNAAISHRGGVVGVARPSLQTLHWALNRRATARRGSSLMSVVWPQWCCLCDGSRVWHQIASAGVVRQSLGSASYHTLQSDMVCMECKIFRNIHSTSAAGVGQGLAIPGSYHDYRLGWIGWQICGDGAQAEGKGVAAANGPVRCRRHAGAFVERGTAAVSSPTSASLSNVQCPLSTVHCPLHHCVTASRPSRGCSAGVAVAVSGRADGLLSIDVVANHSYAALHLVCAGHAATDRPSCWRTNLAH